MNKLILATTFLAIFINNNVVAQEIKMSGIITCSKTNEPIEFVNIGVFNKNKGTVTDQKGRFTIVLSKEFLNDSLTISHVGYKTLKIPVQRANNIFFTLQPKANQLSEVVVISNKKKKNRKIGVKSYNPLLWLTAISEDNDIIENAQKINIPNKSIVKINYVNIYLRRGIDTESSFIRVNFYKNLNDLPGERILFENIVKKKKMEPGWLQIDLTEFNVYIKEDFFIGIEFLPDFKNTQSVYMGAILSKGKGFSRRSSQGKWEKLPGASAINVEIEF
ncbi:carboxypeptidase-like regulatory domain-containing protein [Zhouia amylolytica]|uniref:Carboxypeptidase-like regulatory domain-containing protein n=1 Tax=Zhouia amylolytica AD3 TaxID=1286632 RepID=W2UJA4_9FLAO|nr:carboxypeptidase-like regulatory domain-containing protein [Zhouia amylolytica]ETN94093.1 hypothetical protein P278_28970 [Zhouia amylolytica AD3]